MAPSEFAAQFHDRMALCWSSKALPGGEEILPQEAPALMRLKDLLLEWPPGKAICSEESSPNCWLNDKAPAKPSIASPVKTPFRTKLAHDWLARRIQTIAGRLAQGLSCPGQ